MLSLERALQRLVQTGKLKLSAGRVDVEFAAGDLELIGPLDHEDPFGSGWAAART